MEASDSITRHPVRGVIGVATQHVTPMPNNILRNGRTIQRWQLWTLKILFLLFAGGELAAGSYLQDWGLLSPQFVGAVVGLGLVYLALVWFVTAVGNLWRNGLPERHTLQERAQADDKSLAPSARVKVAAILALFLLVSVSEPVQTWAGAFGQLLGAFLVVTLVEYLVVKSRKRRVESTDS